MGVSYALCCSRVIIHKRKWNLHNGKQRSLEFIVSAKTEVGYLIVHIEQIGLKFRLKYVRHLKWYLEQESEVLIGENL